MNFINILLHVASALDCWVKRALNSLRHSQGDMNLRRIEAANFLSSGPVYLPQHQRGSHRQPQPLVYLRVHTLTLAVRNELRRH